MSLSLFTNFKDRYNNTLPIRGRAVECRPIAQRRRDWEQIVKRYIVEEGALDVEGGEAYGAHLYRTDCVMYMADGSVHITESSPTIEVDRQLYNEALETNFDIVFEEHFKTTPTRISREMVAKKLVDVLEKYVSSYVFLEDVIDEIKKIYEDYKEITTNEDFVFKRSEHFLSCWS
jgi:hypothetical protein